MNLFSKQNLNGNPAAEWLAEEISAIAQKLGTGESDAKRLESLVFLLAKTTTENRGTHLKIQTREDIDFLNTAVHTDSLKLLTGTEKTFSAGKTTPLVFDTKNLALYFFRHYRQEIEIAEKLISKITPPSALSPLAETLIDSSLPFPLNEGQKHAVRSVLTASLTIISGGPGTGKTTLLLRALLCLFSENPDARIILAAPTGKAAGRMKESLRSQLEQISECGGESVPAEILKKIDALVPATLHRTLKTGESILCMNKVPKLTADHIIIDESSMVDQAMMHRLLCAANPGAKLVFLGDKNQLDSVGTGRVFGAICAAKILSGCLIELTESRRFSAQGVLGRFAESIITGDADAALNEAEFRRSSGSKSFRFSPEGITTKSLTEAFDALFPNEIKNVSENADPLSMLKLVDSVRILSPLRKGKYGTEHLNSLARSCFAPPGTATHLHFHGQPILITQNAPQEGLFNGDVGIILKNGETGMLSAYFHGEKGEVRRVPASLLPPHETAYAMSIHKSQGSEFSRLCIVFPPEGSNEDFFSRQLLYTAVTRFKENSGNAEFHLLFDREALKKAVTRDNPLQELLFAR